MSTYTIKYNRSSIHIDGLEIRTTSSGEEKGGVVTYYAENACGALTSSGTRMATAGTSHDVADALKKARGKANALGNKLCKKCEAAALSMIADQANEG